MTRDGVSEVEDLMAAATEWEMVMEVAADMIVGAMVETEEAMVVLTEVSSERAAKDLGATIRTEMVGTNQVGVWLEFAPKGKLETFSSVQLEITSGERTLVSAMLSPSKQTPDTVVVYFSTDA